MIKRICVSITEQRINEALTAAAAAAKQADVVEIRLDLMDEQVIAPFIEGIGVSLLFTNRASWEGGDFTGSEEKRIAPLLEAIAAGVAFVDLELESPQSSWHALTRKCSSSKTKIICSWHNFQTTPSTEELQMRLAQMHKSGADIGKIVTMAHDHLSVLRVLALQQQAAEMKFPLIAFCMGEAGVISRVATTALGGFMTYCAADTGKVAAPGQVKVGHMRSILKLLEDKG